VERLPCSGAVRLGRSFGDSDTIGDDEHLVGVEGIARGCRSASSGSDAMNGGGIACLTGTGGFIDTRPNIAGCC
jgi:hypothetical protein